MKTLVLGFMPREASGASHIPAGPWCFDGQEEHFPDWAEQFTFPGDALANSEALHSAARAAQTLALKGISLTAPELAANWESLPMSYWQTLLAPWAINVASLIVDRAWLAKMLLKFGNTELDVPILPCDCAFEFLDEQDFVMRGVKGVSFNHWLLSRLLELNWPDRWHKTLLPKINEPLPPQKSPSLKENIIGRLRQFNLALPFPKLKGMTAAQAWRYSRAVKKARGEAFSLDLDSTFNFPADLEKIRLPENLASLFTICLPKSLRELKHRPPDGPARNEGKLRIASIAAQEDAAYRQTLSTWKARGNRIGFCQHGGNYGMIQMPATAAFVEYSQDCFITWGWKNHMGGKFVPLPAPQLCAIANSWTGGSGQLIMVGTEMATLRHRLDSQPTPLQFIDYRNAKSAFLGHLLPDILDHVLYRPYFDLPGTLADASWILARFPGIGICKGPLLPQLLRCKLLVLDHHGTTLLEAMAADIPVICYWNRQIWQLTPEAELMLDMLEDSGIWQPSPEAAAKKVNEIWEDVPGWWQGGAVRAARRIFCKNFALTTENPDPLWIERLRKL